MLVRKVLFLDRDGVINKNAAEHDYIKSVTEFQFNPGIFTLLRDFISRGFEVIVLTNQRGIARGLFTEAELEEIHAFMKSELEKHAIAILDIFYCPHMGDSCDCRKPQPGLLRQAATKYTIDLASSVFITDSVLEVDMGKAFGIGTNLLVPKDHPEDYRKLYDKHNF